jgi:hypothetical protein
MCANSAHFNHRAVHDRPLGPARLATKFGASAEYGEVQEVVEPARCAIAWGDLCRPACGSSARSGVALDLTHRKSRPKNLDLMCDARPGALAIAIIGELMEADREAGRMAKGGAEQGVGRRGNNAGELIPRIPTLADQGVDKDLAKASRLYSKRSSPGAPRPAMWDKRFQKWNEGFHGALVLTTWRLRR